MLPARSTTRAPATTGLLAVVVGLVVAGAGPASAAEDTTEEATATPLTVRLDVMTPAVLPRRGVVTLEGSVTNDSDEDWADVNVAPFSSSAPITSPEDLALAAQTPEETAVGPRLEVFEAIGDLGPHESAPFRLRVPRSELPITGDPGVYWIGVHALGTDLTGRDAVADGRARTFVPLLDRQQARSATVPVSLVLPLRQPALRAADGSLEDPGRWVALSAEEGRFTRLADFADSAGSRPLTWVADPSVLDALADLGRGNPPLSLEPTREATTGDASPGPTPSAPPSAESDAPGVPDGAASARARTLVQRLRALLDGQELLTLPYADPDAAALARRRPPLLARATALAGRRAEALELRGRPVLAPPDGYLDPALLPRLPDDADLLLQDQGEPGLPPVASLEGRRLLLADTGASSGGPEPVPATDPLALRQRVLAEAALQVLADADAQPVVVTLPPRWNPGPSWREADFFAGLDTPWLRLAPLPTGGPAYDGELPYPRSEEAAEVRGDNLRATVRLDGAGRTLGGLLAGESQVAEELLGDALQAVSYAARQQPRRSAAAVEAQTAAARAELARVRVTGTDLVSLSSGSGDITVTVVNDLEQAVRVGLRVETDGEVRVETGDPVELGPGQRSTRRLPVRSQDGVHDVTLQPVTADGAAVGEAFTFRLRTSEVGRVIWVLIAAAGALLAVMILRRVVLRVRHRRWRDPEGVA